MGTNFRIQHIIADIIGKELPFDESAIKKEIL